MKVRDVMTANPVCCFRTDTAQTTAQILCDHNIGSVPVIADPQSGKLVGIITDWDICCSIVADGLDPRSTPIKDYISAALVTCREDDDLDQCERALSFLSGDDR